jgi:hypothetical protein
VSKHIFECTPFDERMFRCMDCGVCTNCNGEYYMVHDEVWYSAITAMDKGHMLCVGCLELRLNRLLTKDDFTDAPVNVFWLTVGSTRLKNRLTSEAAAAIV